MTSTTRKTARTEGGDRYIKFLEIVGAPDENDILPTVSPSLAPYIAALEKEVDSMSYVEAYTEDHKLLAGTWFCFIRAGRQKIPLTMAVDMCKLKLNSSYTVDPIFDPYSKYIPSVQRQGTLQPIGLPNSISYWLGRTEYNSLLACADYTDIRNQSEADCFLAGWLVSAYAGLVEKGVSKIRYRVQHETEELMDNIVKASGFQAITNFGKEVLLDF